MICRFMMDIENKECGVYEPTALASFASCLHSQGKKIKMLFSGLRSSVRPRTILKISGTVSSDKDLPVGE